VTGGEFAAAMPGQRTTGDRTGEHRKSDRGRDDLCAIGPGKRVFRCVGAQQQTKVEITGFVLTSVVTLLLFWLISPVTEN
jgi:hypothetical protein